jgi:hypothetical protein
MQVSGMYCSSLSENVLHPPLQQIYYIYKVPWMMKINRRNNSNPPQLLAFTVRGQHIKTRTNTYSPTHPTFPSFEQPEDTHRSVDVSHLPMQTMPNYNGNLLHETAQHTYY